MKWKQQSGQFRLAPANRLPLSSLNPSYLVREARPTLDRPTHYRHTQCPTASHVAALAESMKCTGKRELNLNRCLRENWVKFKALRSNVLGGFSPNDHFVSYQERIKVIYGRQIVSRLNQWMSHKLQQLTVYAHIFSDRKWENYDFNWLLASSCLKIQMEAGMFAEFSPALTRQITANLD